MIVVVDFGAGPGSVALSEPDDFTRFCVSVRGRGDLARADAIMRSNGAGSVSGDDAVVDVAFVRETAGERGAVWETNFTAMLEFAGTKGWLTDDRAGIRAHVERE